MGTTIERTFATRREADLAIEKLVQEHGFERTDIFVSSAGAENSAGDRASGSDAPTVLEEGRNDGATTGGITVSIDIADEERAALIEASFDEVTTG